jgi:hypothetical protein
MVVRNYFHFAGAALGEEVPLMASVFTYLLIMLLLAGDGAIAHAGPAHNRWFFTANEIAAAYRYQENFGARLRQPLQARSCMYGAKQFAAWYYDAQVRLPCRFIMETLRHLREILAVGAAQYLFPLDLDHAHLGIPKKLWHEKYSKLPGGKIFPAMLKDPKLVALYHSAEHLTAVDPKTKKVNPAAKEWLEKRNILAFYDGRPITILPPHPNGNGVSLPPRYHSYGGFDFLASRRGQLGVILENNAILIDITLQIGGPPPSRQQAHSAPSLANH